jgi:hypothetical protein
MTALFITLILGAVFVSTRRMTASRSTPAWRIQAEKDVRALLGEETAEELRELESQERYTHNKNAAGFAFWCGQKTYRDYDGYVRELGGDD